MKIGVNARLLTKPFTGIGQYTRNLVREMALADASVEFVLVVPEKVDVSDFPENVRIEVVPEGGFGSAGMRKAWWEQIAVPQFFLKEKVDLAFFTYPSSPWFESWYKKGVKTLVAVHDCIPWKNVEYQRGWLSKLYHGQTKRAVKKADAILTVSENSKKEIVKFCEVPQERVRVIYNAAGEVYDRGEHEREKFFLYVGGYDERKNVEYLLKEFARVEGFKLVLAGGKLFENDLYKSLDESGENVVKTGFLSEEELRDLYQKCWAFVHFSKEEGFNIPLLEAAKCGAALILSDIAVHREVAGDGAMFVDISAVGAGAAAMKEIMDVAPREKFAKKAVEMAAKYSWKKSAGEAVRLIKDMLSSD